MMRKLKDKLKHSFLFGWLWDVYIHDQTGSILMLLKGRSVPKGYTKAIFRDK